LSDEKAKRENEEVIRIKQNREATESYIGYIIHH